ncbi:hypothetical protein BKI52_09130 [marine bacterium AO1-C]|nr:hypothetical protein BKI52_09130 [marine bacterium AO1-C]
MLVSLHSNTKQGVRGKSVFNTIFQYLSMLPARLPSATNFFEPKKGPTAYAAALANAPSFHAVYLPTSKASIKL